MRRILALAALLTALALPAVAHGTAEPVPTAEPVKSVPVHRHGDYCTPYGCAGSNAAPVSAAAGFGLAALASIWLARHRPFDPR